MASSDFHLDAGKKKRHGGGFGVGAMELEDDDVYDAVADDKSEYDRFAGGPASDEVHAPGRYSTIYVAAVSLPPAFGVYRITPFQMYVFIYLRRYTHTRAHTHTHTHTHVYMCVHIRTAHTLRCLWLPE